MTIRALALGSAFAAAIAFASPALATNCALTDITPNASDCSGFFTGNLLSGNSGDITAQQNALADIGFTWDGDWNSTDITKISGLNGSSTLDFGVEMFGTTYIGVHKGGGRGGGTTSFYVFDAGDGLGSVTWNLCCSSNAVLYHTGTDDGGGGTGQGVPEPMTWALMLGGFGMTGAVMRFNKLARVTADA